MKLEKLLCLSHDAIVGICDNKITYANASAGEFFGFDPVGRSAFELLPESLLEASSMEFAAAVQIVGIPCSVTSMRSGGVLYLAIASDCPHPSPSDFLSGSLIGSMLSSLFNIGLSIDLVSERMDVLGVIDAKLRQYMSILYHSYYSMKRLIGNLGTAMALSTGTIEFMPRVTDLAKLCSDLISTVSIMMDKRVELSFTTECGQLLANIDSEKIERLLLNLIVNSYAKTEEGGKITIRLTSRDNKAIISVDDNGCGIPPEILKSVFSHYECCTASGLSDSETAGLGLGIARGIAALHGGTLIIESRVGIGTSVRVMLPVDIPETGHFASAQSQLPDTSMDNILTELSGQLDSRCYTEEYLD